MAGHSKWANIRHKKGRADVKKGKIFSRIAKEIISAVKIGGNDPKTNPRLRLALQKARDVNMPNDNVERNIKKASSADQANFDDVVYELYGHGGVGIIVEAMTDNKNRTASDMRIATNKKGGSIAAPGSVMFNFDQKGVIEISTTQADEETLLFAATEAGAEGFEQEENLFLITTDPADLYSVKENLEQENIPIQEASLQRIPKTFAPCDEEIAQKNDQLIEWLEGLDDVDAVYHNMQLPGEE